MITHSVPDEYNTVLSLNLTFGLFKDGKSRCSKAKHC